MSDVVTTPKVGLKNLELIKENDMYFLKAEYIEEGKNAFYKHTIPRIYLALYQYPKCTYEDAFDLANIDLGFGKLPMLKNENGRFEYCEILQEKVHELTLDEIEKRLGYKVRIVNK